MKKVTAKNSMIGDWVEYKNKPMQVWRTTQFLGKSSQIDLCHSLNSNKKEVVAKSATPIPITEEWLKLNGFVDRGYSRDTELFKSIGMTDIYYTVKINYAQIHTLDGVYMLPNIQYIHQLQQAYRLATGGKELKVKF